MLSESIAKGKTALIKLEMGKNGLKGYKTFIFIAGSVCHVAF
jgi:hypothetical protein